MNNISDKCQGDLDMYFMCHVHFIHASLWDDDHQI